MVSKKLINNLIDNGLQPFIYKSTDKKGYFNNEYYLEKEKTGMTFGNTSELIDVYKYMVCNNPDSMTGVFLKNKAIRQENNGFFFLDFDLKQNDNISCFDNVKSKLIKMGFWEQVESKRNGNGFHLALKMTMADIEKLEYQGKIYCGKNSFVEILTAGKFLRLCPNSDYIIDNTEKLSINFSKVKYITLNQLLSLSDNKNDKILLVSEFQNKIEIENSKIDFNITSEELKTEEEQLIYAYIKSKKMSYDEAIKMAYGLGSKNYLNLFKQAIPPQKINEYQNLYIQGTKFQNSKGTAYIRNLIEVLNVKKGIIEIEKYLPEKEIEKILKNDKKYQLLIAPTGSGKTFTTITVANKIKQKIIFTVPNISVVRQLKSEWKNIVGASYENIQMKTQMKKYDIIVCTINKLNQIKDIDLSEYILICDEKHTHITNMEFRKEPIYIASKIKEKFKKIIDITATPEPLYLDDYDNIIKFVAKDDKKYDIHLIETDARSAILTEKLKQCKSDLIIILNNDKKFNDIAMTQFKPSISLNSECKEDDIYKEILENQRISDNIKYVFTTDLFSAGLNLNNEVDTTIIINGFSDATLIKQFTARMRKLKNINLILLLPLRKLANVSKNKLIDFYRRKAENKLQQYKSKEFDREFWAMNPGVLQEDFFIFDEDLKIFNEAIYYKAWKFIMSKCPTKDLLICFDEDSYTLKEEKIILKKNDYFFKEEVKEEKDIRKEIKRRKKENTIELIKESGLTAIAFKGLSNYEDTIIDRYEEMKKRKILSEDLIIRILSEDDFLEKSLYWINLRHIGKKEVKLNELRRMCQYAYFKIYIGDTIKIKDICNKNKFKEPIFKKVLETYWETKEVRNSTSRYKQIINRNDRLKISQQDIKELIESNYIFRELNL